MTQFLQMSVMDFEHLSLEIYNCMHNQLLISSLFSGEVAQFDHSLTYISGGTDDLVVNDTQGRAEILHRTGDQ